MSFQLPVLPYSYDAVEPYFDKETMEIHYNKHHLNYVTKANDALSSLPEFIDLSVEDLLQELCFLPENKKTVLRNNAGGHANHTFFWQGLKKGTILKGILRNTIERDFGSVDTFKDVF